MLMVEEKSILIVEDDDSIREALAEFLQVQGFRVSLARNGREGLQMLSTTRKPKVVLLDLMMPEIDGWDFLEEQKKDPDPRLDIPVVVISALPVKIRHSGMNYVLAKPIDTEKLLTILNQICG